MTLRQRGHNSAACAPRRRSDVVDRLQHAARRLHGKLQPLLRRHRSRHSARGISSATGMPAGRARKRPTGQWRLPRKEPLAGCGMKECVASCSTPQAHRIAAHTHASDAAVTARSSRRLPDGRSARIHRDAEAGVATARTRRAASFTLETVHPRDELDVYGQPISCATSHHVAKRSAMRDSSASSPVASTWRVPSSAAASKKG